MAHPRRSMLTHIAFRFVFTGVALFALSGCAVMTTMQQAATTTVSALTPRPVDYDNPAERTSDPWIQQAGVEARGNRPKQSANDPLGLRNVFMSEKARDIERNMGFE